MGFCFLEGSLPGPFYCVDVAHFQGTCYRAANWRYVGETRGIAKSGNGHCYHGQLHLAITEQDLQNAPSSIPNLLGFLLRESMELKRKVEDLRKQVVEQNKQIGELKSRLNLISGNSTVYRQSLQEQIDGQRRRTRYILGGGGSHPTLRLGNL